MDSGFMAGFLSRFNVLAARLSATWAAKLDTVHANFLSSVVWTAAHADKLLNAAQERAVAASGLFAAQSVGDANSLAAMGSIGLMSATTASTTDVDVVNDAGPGVLSFLMQHNSSGSVGSFLTVTIDGVVAFPSTSMSGAYSRRCVVGAFGMNGTLVGGIAFEPIPYKTSLRIQHKVTSGQTVTTLYKRRRTT